MSPELVLQISKQSVYILILVSTPLLALALIVGLVISIFQSVTQIQEQTLVFVPKILAVFLGLLVAGPWMLKHMLTFTENIFSNLGSFVG